MHWQAQFDAFQLGEQQWWDSKAEEFKPNEWSQDEVLAETFRKGTEVRVSVRLHCTRQQPNWRGPYIYL